MCQIIVDEVKPPKFSKLASQLSKLFVDKTAEDEYNTAQHVAAELLELSQEGLNGDFQKSFAKVFSHIKDENSNFARRLKNVLQTNFPDELKAAERQQPELVKKSASSPAKKKV